MDEPSASTPARKAPKLPIPGRRNVLITSALPYVNNVPHLGNIIGCVLSADVFTRYCRLRDYNVIYICGTDEYGTATEIKAMKENVHPQTICDRYHDIHKEVYDWFDISFDMFGRTSNPEQKEVCQAIFHKLMDNNWLSQKTIEQLYCNQCERFLADRFVEGTCPNLICNNESARGDQCQLCETMLTPKELKDPKCQVCRSSPHTRDTNHLFLELPLLKDKLEKYIKSVEGSWSKNAIHITDDWLKRGLEPRCITRDLRWGVSVPHEGFEKKVFYVWFDAPIGYISITKSYTAEWEKWWKDPENVELYQFMGKDNVSFHTVLFPSSLLGTGERWTMVKTICATEYLNYESGKFSKSNGVGVFGNDVKDTGIPAEVWRYYLLINRPEESDTTFSWKDLQIKLNKELLGNLGNFINRVLMFLAKPPGSGYNSILPDIADATPDQLPVTFGEKIGKLVDDYINHMEKVKLKDGLKTAMSISTEGNGYLQHTGFHKIFKDNPSSIKCSIVMKTSVGLVYILATLLEPFMPSFSVKVLRLLNLPPGTYLPLCNEETEKFKRPWDLLQSGHRIGKPEHLFVKLEEVENLEKKYAGSQADRTKRAEDDARKNAKKLGETKLSASPTTVIP